MTVKDPLHPDEITPEWITYALHAGGYLKEGRAVAVEKELLGDSKGFLSSVVRTVITYDRPETSAPRSVVVKIEPEGGDLKDMGDELHAFQREIRFYREVAPNIPIRLPELYYSVDEPPAYSMVMEDLSAYTPGDQVAGMHRRQVTDTVTEIARMHARYWDNDALRTLDWMPDTNRISDDYPEKWPSFVEHFGRHYLEENELELGDRLAEHIGWKMERIGRRPNTIVHADLREDNLLFAPEGSPDPVLILDWQLAIRSLGTFDVARLIGGSEIPEERAGHQLEVLRIWHDTLVAEGVTGYPWNEAVDDLRLSALSLLTYPVHFHTAFVGATGRSMELAVAIITRAFSSALDIDAASVLPGGGQRPYAY